MPAARYWRIHVTSSNGDSGLDVREIEFLFEGVDQTGSGSASASSYYVAENLNPDNAFDGTDSRWATDFSGTWPQWIQYDFGTDTEIDAVSWSVAMALNRAPSDFTIQYSSDGLNWTTAHTETGVTTGWVLDTPRTFEILEESLGTARVTQAAVLALVDEEGSAKVTQTAALVLWGIDSAARVTSLVALFLARPPVRRIVGITD